MPSGTFRGGIHPPENKASTAGLATREARMPARVVILLHENTSCPLTPLVKKGDTVLMGQKVADSDARFSVPAHSSVSGKVVEIGSVRTASGLQDQAIVIESDGQDTPADTISPINNADSLSREEIIRIIREAGIVGMGGAEFPTYAKLMLPSDAKVDTLLINGAECEPYLTADHRVMLEKADDVVAGIRILMKAIGVSKAVVAIESNKPDAAIAMRDAASKAAGIEVVVVRTKYPQGSEKHLIKSVLDREVPSGGLPFQVGVVVSNVGTAASVADRFRKGLPLIKRVVTVTGSAVSQPANLMARVGTTAADLIEQCGGFSTEPGKVIFGGPMMGMAIPNLDVPIAKGTSGILALSEAESRVFEPMNCIRCGRCVEVCPMHLEPALLHQWGEAGIYDEAEKYHALDCIECGACAYVCPSRRNLVQAIKRAKYEINAKRRQAKERRGN